MKYIKKGKEPNSLTEYRLQEYAYYDGYQERDQLKDALLKEQKYICCYCMQRISKDKMKIEHWQPQSESEQLQLTYSNLLDSCLGNEGQPKHLQHCDTHKANSIIKANPTQLIYESIIKFRANGEIYADDFKINKDLKETLNLNYEGLIKNRKMMLDIALKNLIDKNKGTWSKETLKREIDKWENINNPEHTAYCQIIIYHLKKKLAKC